MLVPTLQNIRIPHTEKSCGGVEIELEIGWFIEFFIVKCKGPVVIY